MTWKSATYMCILTQLLHCIIITLCSSLHYLVPAVVEACNWYCWPLDLEYFFFPVSSLRILHVSILWYILQTLSQELEKPRWEKPRWMGLSCYMERWGSHRHHWLWHMEGETKKFLKAEWIFNNMVPFDFFWQDMLAGSSVFHTRPNKILCLGTVKSNLFIMHYIMCLSPIFSRKTRV